MRTTIESVKRTPSQFILDKRAAESLFIAWVLNLRDWAVWSDQFMAWPERQTNHEGDPCELVWKVNLMIHGRLHLTHSFYRGYGDKEIVNQIRADIRLHESGVYDSDGAEHNEGDEHVARMRDAVRMCNILLADAPLPVEAAWRKRDGTSYWAQPI